MPGEEELLTTKAAEVADIAIEEAEETSFTEPKLLSSSFPGI
jgi:hypothetical protein